MTFWERVEHVASLLIAANETPQAQQRWRQVIGVCVVGFFAYALWSCGYATNYGYPGFVRINDLAPIETKLDTSAAIAEKVEVKLLKQEIMATKLLQCNAESKRYYTAELDRLCDDYLHATHSTFDVPGCKDLT